MDADFAIQLEDASKIESKTYIHTLDIRVFNQDFIAENLNLFDAQTKPIIFISKEKVDEKTELDKQKQEHKEKIKQLEFLNNQKESLDKKIDDFHKTAGKAIKDFLLGTVYANVTYNKKTSSEIWTKLLKISKPIKDFVLTEAQLTTEKNYTLLNSKQDEITLTTFPTVIDIEKLLEVEKEVNEILNTSLTSKVIDRLKDNPDIGDWVSKGRNIHKVHKSITCEFCGEPLKQKRLQELEEHYSKQFDELILRIINEIAKLEKGVRAEFVNESHLLYDNLRPEYNKAIIAANAKLKTVNDKIYEWIEALSAKKMNPFENNNLTSTTKHSILSDFNTALEVVKKVIETHNKTSKSHQKLAEQAKEKIEYHFVGQLAGTQKLKDLEKQLEDKVAEISLQEKNAASLKRGIKELEDGLKSDTLAIEEINESMHKFLGRNDIVLERQPTGGYQLVRGGIVAKNLSEGEKTAISLIYFFSKIQENDAVLANQIIILDDPISSFDSNHLFNASSLIKRATNEVKQLFVFTHNFWFFKQVRDWMLKKKKKDTDPEVSHVYLAKQGILSDAGNSLMKYHSEYHFVFNSILNYQDAEEIDESTCFTIANSIRRLLEGFTSFKTPDSSGFNGALQLGMKQGITEEQKDRIFYFINKYSHLDRIESFDTTVETLFEEGKNVVNDTLLLIKKVDEDHYNSMLRVCGIADKLVEKKTYGKPSIETAKDKKYKSK